MKKTTKILINLTVFMALITPALVFSAGLVPDCSPNCNWNDLLALINKVINFILFDLAVPIAAIMFAYAGFKMVIAGEESGGARTQAKEIFLNALFGLLMAAAAWLIISTLLWILGYDGTWIGLKIGV